MKTAQECREIIARAGEPGTIENEAEAIVHHIWRRWAAATDELRNRPLQNEVTFATVATPIILDAIRARK